MARSLNPQEGRTFTKHLTNRINNPYHPRGVHLQCSQSKSTTLEQGRDRLKDSQRSSPSTWRPGWETRQQQANGVSKEGSQDVCQILSLINLDQCEHKDLRTSLWFCSRLKKYFSQDFQRWLEIITCPSKAFSGSTAYRRLRAALWKIRNSWGVSPWAQKDIPKITIYFCNCFFFPLDHSLIVVFFIFASINF